MAQWQCFWLASCPDPTLPQLSRSLWAFQNTIRGLDTIVSVLWAILYLAAVIPSKATPVMDSSTMSASPGFGIFLILGFAVAILEFIDLGAICLVAVLRDLDTGAIASRTIVSDTCLDPEVVQTVEVQ